MDEKSNLLIKKFLPMKNLLLSLAAALCCIATINAQVAVTVGGGSWCSEVSWSLTDASGEEVLNGSCGDYTVTANDGDCFTLTMNDSYGDGWNGNTFAMGDFSTTLDGATATEYFCYTAPAAPASCEGTEVAYTLGGGSYDSEMSFSINGETFGAGSGTVCLADGCFDVTLTDSWGDGWNGGTLTLGSEICVGSAASLGLM